MNVLVTWPFAVISLSKEIFRHFKTKCFDLQGHLMNI